MREGRSPWVLVMLTLVGLGCGDSESGVGGHPTGGGNVSGTTPECGALGQACVGQGLDAPLALGGRFEVAVASQLSGASGPPVGLEAADATVLSATETSVEAVGEGASAVLFVGPDGAVLDFIHLWVVAAEELRIMRYAPTGVLLGRVQDSVQLLPGDELLVSVDPYANAQPLMGNFDMIHVVEGEAVAVVPDSVAAWYRVVARAPGQATVVFSALGLEERWDIEVLP